MKRYDTWHCQCDDGEMVQYKEAMEIIEGLQQRIYFLSREEVEDKESFNNENQGELF